MQTYAMTPEGKRMVRCGCNSDYLRDDPATECFEDMDACAACGKYPWYNLAAERGGSKKVGPLTNRGNVLYG